MKKWRKNMLRHFCMEYDGNNDAAIDIIIMKYRVSVARHVHR